MLILALVVLIVLFFQSNQMQVKSPTIDDVNYSLIGGDQDSHGCFIGAGYLWCPSNQKCQKFWEEECPPDFIKGVNFVINKEENRIVFEEPGKPALTANYIFDASCKVGEVFCSNLEIENGTRAEVEGITLDDAILITNLKL